MDLPIRELHIHQHKARLNEADDAALRDLANRTGVPAAVIVRAVIRDYLQSGAAIAVSHVEAQARRG